MQDDPKESKVQKRKPLLPKSLALPGVILILFIMLLLVAGIAWRQLDPVTLGHLKIAAVSFKSMGQTPINSAEINEQIRESSGIILATVVIMLIILGGTYGGTRRKSP